MLKPVPEHSIPGSVIDEKTDINMNAIVLNKKSLGISLSCDEGILNKIVLFLIKKSGWDKHPVHFYSGNNIIPKNDKSIIRGIWDESDHSLGF